MNVTMKMLTLSVLVVAMMVLTQAAAEKEEASSAPAAKEEEEEESKTLESRSTPDAEEDESDSGSEDDEDETESTSEDTAGSGNETDTQGKHTVAKRSIRCACGWVRYRRRCFRYFPRAKSWALAQRHCQAYRGNLASVHNRYEDYYLRRLARGRLTWIGLSDAQQERYWFWIDGTLYNYAVWARGQPNNYRRREHCARMNWSGAKRWDDAPCSYHHGYICVK